MLARRRRNFGDALRAPHDGLSRKNRGRKSDRVTGKPGRLKEGHRRVRRRRDVKAEPGERGRAGDVRRRRNALHAERDRQAGIHVPRTSHVERDPETAVRTRREIAGTEVAFRSLKSGVGPRPVGNSGIPRIAARPLTAVPACHAVRPPRNRPTARGLHARGRARRDRRAPGGRRAAAIREAGGNRIAVRRDARPDADARTVARAAGLAIDSRGR